MKKILLLISANMLALATLQAQIEINETNFPDQAFKEYVSTNIDKNQDGSLNDEEIESTAVITTDDSGITSLEGIEHFKELRVLNCGNMQLSSLDVSKNTNLQQLYCNDNHLTALNVSGCARLAYLYCQNNHLTSLDLSNNTALQYIDCSNNTTRIDVGSDKSFDLSQIAGFNIAKTSEWQGGTIAGSLLTCTDDAVYYKYETGYTGTYEEAKEITLSMICYSPIDEYYFPDHGFRQYVKDSFDKDNDGIMTFDELMEVERISLPDDNNTYNIYNLKGVEYFKNLKYLTCTETSLQSLDVSKNPLLEDLALNENELTTLKVSGLSKLLNLYCENNRLTSLDVSGCTALRTIRCGYNELESLNVTGCEALAYIYCYYNHITTLDVSGCQELKELSCFNNSLTSLSAKGCTALTGLSTQYCRLLTNLDISGCSMLESLNISSCQLTSLDMGNYTNLKYLQCEHNKLESLNINGCTSLQSLNCNTNELTSLSITGCPSLETITGYDNKLTFIEVGDCSSLESLDCRNNQLTSLDLSKNSNLRYLGVDDNLLMVEPDSNNAFDLSQLPGFDITKATNWEGGSVNNSILTFDKEIVTYNYETGYTGTYEGAKSVKFTIQRPPQGLEINDTNFPSTEFQNYIRTHFDKDRNNVLSDEEINAAENISSSELGFSLKGIEHFNNLKVLICNNNGLSDLDITNNKRLEYLDCSGNNLESLDISQNVMLKYLNCSDNQLTDLEISNYLLLESLSCHTNKLAELDASGCISLQYLNCYQNQLTHLSISGCTELDTLTCETNLLVSLVLNDNPNLKHLECSENKLSGLDLSNNAQLIYLECSNNLLKYLDVTRQRDLEQLYCDNNQLTSLDLSNKLELIYLEKDNNSLTVEVNPDNTFDLSQLPGFDITKVYTWNGGTVNGNILTFNENQVSYQYSTGCYRFEKVTFYLKSNKLITGINDIGTNEIKVYPDGKNIMITGTEELVEIYNISGQLIYKGKEHQITVPNQGVYLVKAEGKVTKVLIQ